MKAIQLEPKHFIIVNKILKELNVLVYEFGSWAKNCAKPISDLDLCLKDNLDKSTVGKLQDAFEESDLPFKVDIIVWSDISDSFKKHIEKDLIKFENETKPAIFLNLPRDSWSLGVSTCPIPIPMKPWGLMKSKNYQGLPGQYFPPIFDNKLVLWNCHFWQWV